MKLKYTTKVFIVVNLIIIAFRTLQIMFLTEKGTRFLKPDWIWISIVGSVVCVLALMAMFSNAYRAVRQPECLNCKGIPSAAAAGVSATLYLASGLLALMSTSFGSKALFITGVLSAVTCVLLAISAIKGRSLSKLTALFPISYWVMVLITAYLYYTERPLRVRTVYEVFAVCAMLLFSSVFGKAVSGVKSEKNFRMLYPLGLTASTLCIASTVPEFLSVVFGFSDNIAKSPVSPLTLAAGAVFAGFFTINTFKKSNTIHPKQKLRMEVEAKTHMAEDDSTQ